MASLGKLVNARRPREPINDLEQEIVKQNSDEDGDIKDCDESVDHLCVFTTLMTNRDESNPITLIKVSKGARSPKFIDVSSPSENTYEKEVSLSSNDRYSFFLQEEAQGVLDKLALRDVITWNVLIAGYVEHGFEEKALNCLVQMQTEGFSPNAITFIYILKACGSIGAIQKGEEIHGEVRKQGLLESNDMLLTALVDMYAKCGALAKAHEVFDMLPARNVVTWNALMAGYAEHACS
ncbi:hypothetical protein L7F22_011717 [Adiantum nelumboides]|nr:hypothetical protein [Adiantum nelumboides]